MENLSKKDQIVARIDLYATMVQLDHNYLAHVVRENEPEDELLRRVQTMKGTVRQLSSIIKELEALLK